MENPFKAWSPVIFRSAAHHAEIVLPDSPPVTHSNAIFFFERLREEGFRYLGEGSRNTVVCEKLKKL